MKNKHSGLLEKIRSDFPELRFRTGDKFTFRPPRTIIVGPDQAFWDLLLLHELSHAILKHNSFQIDIQRLKMEAEAWKKARELAAFYEVEANEEIIQENLDTYRDWLHKKSRCPKCGLTRFQTPDGKYHCPRCEYY